MVRREQSSLEVELFVVLGHNIRHCDLGVVEKLLKVTFLCIPKVIRICARDELDHLLQVE